MDTNSKMETETGTEWNETEWKETYEILRKKHEEAESLVSLAKKSEEQGNNEVALIKYKVGLIAIDNALATPVALPDDPDHVDETWRSAVNIVQMLKRTRGEVMHRIAILSPTTSQSEDSNMQCDREPSPTEIDGKTKRPRTFSELATELKNMEIDFNDTQNLPSVLELLFLCHGVKLYRINANGEVTTTDESLTLRIVRLDQNVTQNLDATYFMQIIPSSAAETIDLSQGSEANAEQAEQSEHDDGKQPELKKIREGTPSKKIDTSLIYPLVHGVSPCFRTEFGAFVFPDIQSNVQGAAFGIVVPQPADEIVLEILDSILHGIVRQEKTDHKDETAEEREERNRQYASDRISENIVHGACLISNGLVKGSEQVSKLVSYTTPYVLSKMNKAPENTPPVSHKVANGIEIAKTATGVAVGITSFVASTVGSATIALGRFLAPHVHAQGSKLLSKSMGFSADEAKDKMSCVLTVAAGAVEGFGTVYAGLEQSAGILGKNLSENSVKVIEHKYGSHAGALAHDTFDTVGNMINLSRKMSLITPKSITKNTARCAMKGEFKPRNPHTNYAPAGTLYPDLTEFSKKLSQPKL